MPFILKLVDPKSGDEKSVVISVDDGIRPGTTLADLSKLKPAFKKSGSTTAGMIFPQHLQSFNGFFCHMLCSLRKVN